MLMTTTPPPRNRALHCLLHKWGKQRTSTSRWGCSEWVRKEQGNKKKSKAQDSETLPAEPASAFDSISISLQVRPTRITVCVQTARVQAVCHRSGPELLLWPQMHFCALATSSNHIHSRTRWKYRTGGISPKAAPFWTVDHRHT